MGRARGVLAGLLVLVLATCAGVPAFATGQGGATYRRDGTNTSLELDITAARFPAGVYALGPAFRSADISFDRGSSFAGTLYACDVKDADADDSGAVDAAAGCDSLASISGDVSSSDVRIKRRFFVLDVDTVEGGSTTSRLTIFGSFGVGGGSGVPVANYAALASVDPATTPFVKVNDCDDLACASPGTGSTHVPFYYTGSAWAPFPGAAAGIASVEADASPTLGGNLDPNGKAIGTRNYYVSTEAEFEAALTAIGDGVGVVGQTGGTIYLVGEVIGISDGVTLCTATAGTGGRNGLRILGMGPGMPGSISGHDNGATILRWTGTNGGDLLSAGACNSLEIANVVLNGRSCLDANANGFCDSDGTTPVTRAANLIQVLNTSGGPLKLHLHDSVLTGASDYAIKGNTSGQWDDSTIANTVFYDNGGDIHFASSQNAGMVLGPNVLMTQLTSGSSNPHLYVEYGEVTLSNSYFGFNADSQVGALVGTNAVSFTMRDSVCETDDDTLTQCVDADATPTNGGIQSITLVNNKEIWNESGAVFADIAVRGNVTVRGNRARQSGSTSGLTPPTIEITRDTGFAGNTTMLDVKDNYDYRVRADYTGFPIPQVWVPTIGAGVLTDPGSIASATLPATSAVDCIDGTIGIDIDDGALKTCENDAWIDPPNLFAATAGAAANVPYYTGTSALGSESVFTYNASTNTLRAQLVQGSVGLVAGVDDTADGVITIHDNSSNNQINLYPGNPTADLDFILPDDYGLVGDCIATDGAGTLYFDTCGSGGGGNVSDNTAENISGTWEIQDDVPFQFGTDADWAIEYDEGVDDQLLIRTTKTAATAISDPLLEILVGTTPTADQQVFGVAKGTQATNTELFTLDEDGDGVFLGGVIASNFNSAADATAGGSLEIKEGSDDGTNTFTIKVPDSGLTSSVTHTVTAAGKLPANAIAETIAECFPVYSPTSGIAGTDDITSLWRAPAAITISEVWCETDTGTATADLQIDDGTPADIMGTDLTCDASGEVDNTSLTGGMADGDRLDLAITSVASSPTRLTFCVEYTYN